MRVFAIILFILTTYTFVMLMIDKDIVWSLPIWVVCTIIISLGYFVSIMLYIASLKEQRKGFLNKKLNSADANILYEGTGND